MSRSFKNDLFFGLSNEEPIRKLLKKYFKDEEDIIKTKNIFCKYDFEGTSKRKYELKSRTNEKNKYPSTIIPKHKINKETIENGLIFVFNFTDKCCFIKYDEEEFKKFPIKTFKIYRAGKYDPPTDHYLIPVEKLIDIN
jgi:hypothetical protein